MKRLLLLLFIFSGCSMITDSNNLDKIGWELYYVADYSEIDSVPEISIWIKEYVTTKVDSGDYWQSPEETLTLGTGDCEDIAILFINIAYIVFGEKWNLICVDSRSIVEGGFMDHTMVEKDGVIIEPQTGIVIDIAIGYRYEFKELFL